MVKVHVAKIKALTFAEIDRSSTSSVGTEEETEVPMKVIPEQVKTAAKERVELLKREQTRLMEIEEEYGIWLSSTCPESLLPSKKCNVRVLRGMDPVYQAVRDVKRAQNIPQSKKYREHDEGYEKPQSSNEEDTE